jgi:glycosyltransferase involved in cell wall biosynthesis
MKTCEAFANQGVEVELVVPKRKNMIKDDPFEYFKVKKNFKITKLRCLDTVRFGWWGFWLEALTFTESVACYLFFKKGLFYTREEFAAVYLRFFGKYVVWEAHTGQRNIFAKLHIWFKSQIVVISNGLKDLYVKLGVSLENILVAPDAVEWESFHLSLTKDEAREKLGWAKDEKIALYAGSLYAWKGTDTLKEAEKHLSGIKVLVISNMPYTEMPLYLKAADVLVLPNSARYEVSRSYTSPMKLFEYMASGTSIVASDLSSIREILDESMAYFFKPDDSKSLAQAIRTVLADSEDAQAKALRAKERVKEYSWKKRAEKILKFIK